MAIFSTNQYKTEQGVIRTKSLFYELSYDSPEQSVFTTKEQDILGHDCRPLLSFPRLFVDLTQSDPTEVCFADTVFGSWDAWDKIRNSDKRIQAIIEKARTEASIRRKAAAFRVIADEISTGGRSAFTAAKYLIEEQWNKGSNPDERKSRQKARDTAEEAFTRTGVAEDLKRLRDEGLIQ